MENSPSPAEPEVKIASPPGTASAFVEIPVLSAPTHSEAAKSSVADVTKQPLPANDLPDSIEKVEFKYEFSTYHEGRLYFVHLWDTDDRSALERVTCECIPADVDLSKLIKHSDTGNHFVECVDGTKWCFTKEPYKPSFTLDTDCKPTTSERLERRSKPGKVDSVLDGLL